MSDNAALSSTPAGQYLVVVKFDSAPENPRNWGQGSVMLGWHRRYAVGNEDWKMRLREDLTSADNTRVDGFSAAFLQRLQRHDVDSRNDVCDFFEGAAEKLGWAVRRVFLLDHSGVMYRTTPFGDKWDSGQVGWIYITPAKWAKERDTAWVLEDVLKCLDGEVETYSDWANGNVFGYEVVDPRGEVVESCWGFYGDTDIKDAVEEQRGLWANEVWVAPKTATELIQEELDAMGFAYPETPTGGYRLGLERALELIKQAENG